MKVWRALALGLAALAVLPVAYVLLRRFAYPYDLEWMEGGMLCHALRLHVGQPIYAPPSVDFVPFLYTPLYPALLAALAPVFGLGYGVGRALSLLGVAAALVLGYVYARRAGQRRATAAVALALPLAAFVPTGAWLDLARPDSFSLGLTTAGLFVGWWRRESHAGVAAAAALLVAAFFAKQTASPFMVALGLALLVTRPRVVPTYVATLAALGLPILWGLNHASHGWFWTYVFALHQRHDFYRVRAFVGTPLRLLLLLGPGVLCVPWALVRRPSPDLQFISFVAAVGIGAACLGFGTQWAFTNAFLPGIWFPSVAMGAAAGRLITSDERTPPPPLRPSAVYLALALSLACAPGGLLPRAGRLLPDTFGITPTEPTGYSLAAFLPAPEERRAGDALIARLKAAPGEVLVPFHPFYAHLAGKRTYLHRMGVLDVGRAGMGAPRGLADALERQLFSLIVMDDKIEGNWGMWPRLLERYRVVEQIAGPRVVSGAQTRPRYLLEPIAPARPSAPPGGVPPPSAGGVPPPTSGGGVIDRDLQ
jgi:hypothetical protein